MSCVFRGEASCVGVGRWWKLVNSEPRLRGTFHVSASKNASMLQPKG